MKSRAFALSRGGHAYAHRPRIGECLERVTELDDPTITRLLAQKAQRAGFASDQQSVEIKGLCTDCQAQHP